MSEVHSSASAGDGLELSLPGSVTAPRAGAAPPRARIHNVRVQPTAVQQAPARQYSLRRRVLVLADVAAILVSYSALQALVPLPAVRDALVSSVVVLPLWLSLNKLLGLYDRDSHVLNKSTLDEFPRIVQSVGLATALLVLVEPLATGLQLDRPQILIFIPIAVVVLTTARGVVRGILNHWAVPERCLVVGTAQSAELLALRTSGHPEYGAELVGFVNGTARQPASSRCSVPFGGTIADFEEVCGNLKVDRVLLASSSVSDEEMLEIVGASKQLGLKVSVVPGLFEAIGEAVEVDHLAGATVLGVRGLTRTRSSLMSKRAMDVVGAGLGLIVLSPFLALIALAIKLTSPGPVVFKQTRIGRDNRRFELYKFRTMFEGADELKPELAALNEAVAPMFKIAADPRLTPLGRFLRRYVLDELPQLWNVVRGEMSLVGPRPLIPFEDNHIVGPRRARLELTPGLTGPWQVLGASKVPFTEMVKLDYQYVAQWSLWNDIKLLIRTVTVVFSGRGV